MPTNAVSQRQIVVVLLFSLIIATLGLVIMQSSGEPQLRRRSAFKTCLFVAERQQSVHIKASGVKKGLALCSKIFVVLENN